MKPKKYFIITITSTYDGFEFTEKFVTTGYEESDAKKIANGTIEEYEEDRSEMLHECTDVSEITEVEFNVLKKYL